MFNLFKKEEKENKRKLLERIELLEDRIWDIENPKGELIHSCDLFSRNIFYKPSRNKQVKVCTYFNDCQKLKACKIKVTQNATYIALEFCKYNMTEIIDFTEIVIIKDSVVTKIDFPIDLKNFDKEFKF